jgi:glycogen operon protein
MTGSGGQALGAHLVEGGVEFAVWSGAADHVWVSLFDAEDREFDRVELARGQDGVFARFVAGLEAGARYGIRAEGPYDPRAGQWFDPARLLVDPYAAEISRPYRYDPILTGRRGSIVDTATLMPKAVVQPKWEPLPTRPPAFAAGGLIYELSVRAFTMRHPAVPEHLRGTVGALAHPAIIEHLQRIGVGAVELMPITASMDERHLPPLGLSNAWGYNPVTFMALDPRLSPGGWTELRATVDALHAAGIAVILDLVFNHTAESDEFGPTLSLRGLDSRAYYRHLDDGRLVNDTGCGNTVDCDHPAARRMVLDTLRMFVERAGVDGFRFDLAPILGRREHGFDPDTPLFRAMIDDPVLGDRLLIAEPWDIGPGGYQLGAFPPPFLEWNDRFRDDIRRFWRGDPGTIGALATRIAGSSDIFARDGLSKTRTVNFIAAHDGMSLADIVAYREKHNLANGEDNRDGHDDNLSWNNGVEGPSSDIAILAARRNDLKALLATLFVSRGTIMLTAGDEFGRTQDGNNNAYAQDNEITWIDWSGRDRELEAFVAALAALRKRLPALSDTEFLDAASTFWLRPDGMAMSVNDWDDPGTRALTLIVGDGSDGAGREVAIAINGATATCVFSLPTEAASTWHAACASAPCAETGNGMFALAARSVAIFTRADETSANRSLP